MLDLGERAPDLPVLVGHVLVRPAQRGAHDAGRLGLQPRQGVVAVLADEPLDQVHQAGAALADRGAAGDGALACLFLGRVVGVAGDAVRAQERGHLGLVPRPHQHRQQVAAVLGLRDRGHGGDLLGRVPGGLAVQRAAPHHPVHEVELGALGDRLVDGAGEVLAPAGPVAAEDGGQHPDDELLAGDDVRLPGGRGDRRQVVVAVRQRIVAAVHDRSAEGQVDQVIGPVGRPRPVVAERRHPRDDQPRMPREEGVPAQLGLPGQQGLVRAGQQQHVGRPDERPQRLDVGRFGPVDHDRALAPVVLPEEERGLGVGIVAGERPQAAGGAALGRLDLDHVGAQAGQLKSGVRRQLIGDLDDANAVQHTRHA